jgi:exosortase/archaeosortase family protein
MIYVVLQSALWYVALKGYLDPVHRITANLTGVCSNLTGVPASVAGNDIRLATRILRIDLDCTGIALMLIYVALVFAYPLSVKRKLVGLAVGLPVIAGANLVRLTAVAQLSGRLGDREFLFVHDYLFKVLMMAVVIVLWGVYLTSAKRHAR